METQTKRQTVVEYGELTAGDLSAVTRLDKRPNPLRVGETWALSHHTAGYECAGSAARWTAERWSVLTYSSGEWHGRSFKTLAEARECFDVYTA